MRSDRGRREGGLSRPPTAFWIACVVLFVWGGIGYMKSVWAAMEYKGYVRTTILSNPRMKQDEFRQRLVDGAGRIGVVLDEPSLVVDQGAQTVLGAGGIGRAEMRIQVPTQVLLFRWNRTIAFAVEP